MDRAQVGVLEQVHDKVLRRLFLDWWCVCVFCEREEKTSERERTTTTRRRRKRKKRRKAKKLPHLLQRQQRLGRPPEGFRGHAVGDLSRLEGSEMVVMVVF